MSLSELKELEKELLSLPSNKEKQELFVSKKDVIQSAFDSEKEDQVLKAYSISVEIYADSLFKEEKYGAVYVFLEHMEQKFRAYKFSDEKMRILEKFQYMLAFSLNKTKNYYRSRDAYDALVHCRPENKLYHDNWKQNELKIAKKNTYMILLVGIIVSAISYSAKAYSKSDSYDTVFYSGLMLILASFVYYFYTQYKLNKN